MEGRSFRMGPDDVPRVEAFLDWDPIANLALRRRLATAELDTRGPCGLYGYEQHGRLLGVCYYGSTIYPVGAHPQALDAFAEYGGPLCRAGSMVGRSDAVLGLHDRLARRWGWSWQRPRNIRYSQPLMVWEGPSQVDPEPSLRQLTEAEYDSYLAASVHMYTEEIGVSPLEGGSGYAHAVRERLRAGHAFGVVRQGQVLFKADIGITFDGHAQIQGVWLTPGLRGRGLAAPAMTALVNQVRSSYPRISLYVNDFNTPAIRTYLRTGFVQIGAMSTVHYC